MKHSDKPAHAEATLKAHFQPKEASQEGKLSCLAFIMSQTKLGRASPPPRKEKEKDKKKQTKIYKKKKKLTANSKGEKIETEKKKMSITTRPS